MKYKKILVRRLDILEFIMKRGSISPYELVERFNYRACDKRVNRNYKEK